MKNDVALMLTDILPPLVQTQQDLKNKVYRLEQEIMELRQLVHQLIQPVQPVQSLKYRDCSVCGITAERSIDYICPHFTCPLRIPITSVQPAVYLNLNKDLA